ncbi:hypothetical protein Bhyg_12060, partial [Pseudolycoriella hygida]
TRAPEEKDRYKATASVTKEITLLVSALTTGEYTFYLDQLRNLKNQIMAPPATSTSNNTTNSFQEGEHSSSDFRSRNSTRFGDASVTETVSGHKEAETTLPTPDVIVNNSVAVNSPHDLPAIGSTALTSNNLQTDPFANRLVIVGPTSRELQLVELPYKRVSIGRPKGSRNTVIGIRKKKFSNKIQSSEEKAVPKRSDRIRRSKQVAQKRVL